MDNTIKRQQQIEEPKERGRPQIHRPPRETKPRGRPRIIKRQKDPKTRGRPRIERPPK